MSDDLHEVTPCAFLANGDTREPEERTGTLPKSEPEALRRINLRLPEGAPTVEGDHVYLLPPIEAGSDRFVPSRWMYVHDSSLRNVAKQAANEGFALMNSHRTGPMGIGDVELPIGKVYAGSYEAFGGRGSLNRTLVSAYMLKGAKPNGDSQPSTDEIYRSIMGGVLHDASLGLFGGDFTCRVCDGNLMDGECPHVPGTTHRMDQKQIQLSEKMGVPGGRATYYLCNAKAGELSPVYDGAVPGAGFKKALALSRCGDLSPEACEQAANVYVALARPGDFRLPKRLWALGATVNHGVRGVQLAPGRTAEQREGPAALQAANYREASDSAKERCGNCHYFLEPTGLCSMFNVPVEADYTCDEWATEEMPYQEAMSPAPVRRTFAKEAETALAAVEALLQRAEEIADLRARDGRALSRESQATIDTLLEKWSALKKRSLSNSDRARALMLRARISGILPPQRGAGASDG